MGYGSAKIQAYENQNGQCTICGEFLKNNWVIHHIKNRCQGLDNSASNLECRCLNCERYMHANYPYGNYEGRVGDEPVKRKRNTCLRKRCRRNTMSKLRRKAGGSEKKNRQQKLSPAQMSENRYKVPSATFRTPNPARPKQR